MYIQQIYTNCLAQAAYYIESNGVAAIVDPLRDVDAYINLAKSRNANIKYVLETHFHADFVSGHLDIARQTGASIVFGPSATPNYHAFVAKDNTVLHIGDCEIEVLHTPGHTLESACFLLYDENKKPYALFSGDTVFIGDVGRPDLLSGNLPAEVLAGQLFDSIQSKILPLNDDIILYPGHGAGSACGKNLSKETVSTVGEQKKTNYALQYTDRDAFVKAVVADQPIPPSYFFSDAMINKTGYEAIEAVMEKEMTDLTASELAALVKNGAMILDTRAASDFAEFHIKGALNIGLDGMFAVWAGTFLPVNTPLVIINSLSNEREPITRLLRVGFENIKGYYDGDLNKLVDQGLELSKMPCIHAKEVAKFAQQEFYQILDVRNCSELEIGQIKDSIQIPLNQLHKRFEELDKSKPTLVYCAGGYRSMIAASLLERHGFENLCNLNKGFNEYAQFLELESVAV